MAFTREVPAGQVALCGWYSHGADRSSLDSVPRLLRATRWDAGSCHPARTMCAACRFENSWRFPDDSSEIIRKYQIGSDTNRINLDSVSKYLSRYSESLEYYYPCYIVQTYTAVSVFSNLRQLSDTHLQCNFEEKEKKKEREFERNLLI